MSGNILFVTRWYIPEWKACTIRIAYFTKALRDRRFKVTILIPRYPHEKIKNTSIYGEEVIEEPFISLPRRLLLEPWTPAINSIVMFRKYVKEMFDIVIASVPPHDVAYIAWYLWKLGLAKRLIIDIRDIISTYTAISNLYSYRLPLIQSRISILGVSFFHDVLSRAHCITTATLGIAKYYKTVNSNIHVIYNGADYELFTKGPLDKKEQSMVSAVFVGDVEARYHLIDVILKSLALLKRRNVLTVKLKIIGCTRPSRRAYSTLARSLGMLDNVEFIDTVPYYKIPKLLCSGDFGIVGRPDVLEWKLTIPVKVYEYIACGLPVFAFGPPRSELQFFVEGFDIGMYVPSTDPEVLAKELAKFIKNLDKYDRDHILRVARFFNRRRWARKFADLVESVCKDE